MESLVFVLIVLVAVLYLLGIVIEFAALAFANRDIFYEHILDWRILYGMVAYGLYLGVVYLLTRKSFPPAGDALTPKRRDSLISGLAKFLARPLFFFLMTFVVWLRSDLLVRALRFESGGEDATLVLSVVFGLVFAFYPTSTFRAMFYSGFSAHVRALYVIVACFLSFGSLLISVAAWFVVLLIPGALFYWIADFAQGQLLGGLNMRSASDIALVIAGLSLFLMTVRGTWSLGVRVYKEMHQPILARTGRVIDGWRAWCNQVTTSIHRTGSRLGAYLGGDAS